MSLSHSPQISLNGLVLCLDAANRKSYPGSGTTWTDLSDRGNNGTLVNGVGYNGSNGGSLSFDGTNQYVDVAANSNGNFSVGSVECWVKMNSTSVSGFFVARTNNALGGAFSLRYNGTAWNFLMRLSTTTQYSILGNSTPTTSWTHLCGTYDGNIQIFYVNAVQQSTTNSITGTLYTTAPYLQTVGANTSGTGPLAGKISNTKLYNRALSASEVKQNYNALKSRYGLT